MEFKIISDPAGNYEELNTIWDMLPDSAIPSAFRLDKIMQWWKRYGDVENNRFGYGKYPCFVIGMDGGQVKCILPLMKMKRKKFRYFFLDYLEFYSQSLTAHTLDIAGSNLTETDVYELFSYISGKIKFDVLQLSYLPENSIISKTFKDNTGYHSGKVIIPADDSYENIRSGTYSKNLRHILNKFRRRLNSLDNPVYFEVLVNKNQIENYKESIRDISLSKLEDGNLHSIYEDRELGEKYFNGISGHPDPYCAIIRDNRDLLSYNMGYVEDSVVYALDASYNRQFGQSRKIGMGILAYDQVVKHFAGRVKYIDMGPGLIDYKFRFSKHMLLTFCYFKVSGTWKGILFKNRLNKQNVRQHESVKKTVKKYRP